MIQMNEVALFDIGQIDNCKVDFSNLCRMMESQSILKIVFYLIVDKRTPSLIVVIFYIFIPKLHYI